MRITCVFALCARLVCAAALSPADVRSIYEKLADAAGNGLRTPLLNIRSEAQRAREDKSPQTAGRAAAWYDPNLQTITIDQKTITLCSDMGSARARDCVAMLLGHELAHYYNHHAWGGDFGAHFAELNVGKVVGARYITPEERLTLETQADQFGDLYAALAGFDPAGVARETLHAIYAGYGLKPVAASYPSLAERQKIAEMSAENLRAKFPLFEAGKQLFLLAEFASAARVFDEITAWFPSREMLNNAGVSYAMAGSGQLPPDRMAWAYPWTLDGESRLLPPPASGRGEISPESARAWLEQARQRLTRATERDPGYAVAYLNLACVEDLLDRHGAAKDHASDALKHSAGASQTASLAHLAHAIAVSHDGDIQAARSEASSLENSVARSWNAWWDTGQPARPPLPAFGDRSATRTAPGINGLEPAAVRISAPATTVAGQPLLRISSKTTPDYRALAITVGRRTLRSITTGPHYEAPTGEELRIGAEIDEIQKFLGRPAYVQAMRAGQCSVYTAARLIICVDNEHRVQNWTSFEWQ